MQIKHQVDTDQVDLTLTRDELKMLNLALERIALGAVAAGGPRRAFNSLREALSGMQKVLPKKQKAKPVEESAPTPPPQAEGSKPTE